MEKRGFVVSRKEQTRRRNRYYALNMNMLCCYIKGERFRKLHYDSPKSKALHFDEAKDKSTASEFQKELAKRDRTGYLSRWSIIKKFDFLTFLAFLREEAKKMNDEDMVRIITENISNIHEIEKAVHELKFSSEYLKRSALDNEARKIYKAQTAAEKLSDAIEEREGQTGKTN